MKKLALVLGGGSAKGYAHIGVLKLLEKHNLRPDLIVGTSMGALVGGMYSAGYTINELREKALNFNSLGNFSLISTLFKGNLLNVDKVKNFLNSSLGDKTHADCDIKFISVATDLKKGKAKVFKSGKLNQTILASISIPGVFPICEIDDELYCDGGIVNNLAEDVARQIMPEAVIVSIDVIGEYHKQVETNKMKMIETFLNASTLLTQTIVKLKPQLSDIRVTISQPEISQLDFSKDAVEQAIRNGVNSFKNYIQKIKSLLEE